MRPPDCGQFREAGARSPQCVLQERRLDARLHLLERRLETRSLGVDPGYLRGMEPPRPSRDRYAVKYATGDRAVVRRGGHRSADRSFNMIQFGIRRIRTARHEHDSPAAPR